MIKADQINKFSEYLDALQKLKNRYMILIAVQGEWQRGLSKSLAEKLIRIGIKTNLYAQKEVSYIAVLDKGKVIHECVGQAKDVCYYKCKYATSNFNIVSKAKAAHFIQSDTSRVGIAINDELLTFNRRGINFVVYDKYTASVLDAVNFDTYSQTFKVSRTKSLTKLLLGRLSELHIGCGYSIAQWLYDMELNNVTICAEPQFPELTKLVALSLKMNDKIIVKNRFTPFTISHKLEYDYKNHFQYEDYTPLNILSIQPGEVFLNTAPFPNEELRQLVERTGAIYFDLAELIDNTFSYIKSEEAILKLLSEYPGVKAATFMIPEAKNDPSEETKRLKREGISREFIISELKKGHRDSEYMSRYIKEDTNYTIEDWLEIIAQPNPEAYNNEYGHRVFKDKHGKYMNIVNGHRITANVPENYDNTIYILGGCNTFGIYNADDETFSSKLQLKLNEYAASKKRYRVENYGHFLASHWCDLARVIGSLKPKAGDMILYHQNTNKHSKIPHMSMYKANLPVECGDFYCDSAGHYSANMHQFIAEKLFDMFIEHKFFTKTVQDFEYRTSPIPLMGIERKETVGGISQEYQHSLNEYKKTLTIIKEENLGKVGSIVMNCNPFTLGHRYLIEYAASKVKHLFIFAVEEDKSVFPFEDRFKLMKQGTSDLENVTVLPSGKFIISSLTFSDYFQKSEIQDRDIDPSQDIELFAKEIAPTLGITVRFAGEEPLDKVTKQYNDTMQRILPQHGIAFEVIPRKEDGGAVISASRVRALLETKDFDAIAKIVPPSTLKYLKERFSK